MRGKRKDIKLAQKRIMPICEIMVTSAGRKIIKVIDNSISPQVYNFINSAQELIWANVKSLVHQSIIQESIYLRAI